MGGLRIRDDAADNGTTTYAVESSKRRPTSGSVRSEPHRRSGSSGNDRETIVSYGGRSDPGAQGSPQTWQHPGYRGTMLSTQSGAT